MSTSNSNKDGNRTHATIRQNPAPNPVSYEKSIYQNGLR